jgi:hypothetical protein
MVPKWDRIQYYWFKQCVLALVLDLKSGFTNGQARLDGDQIYRGRTRCFSEPEVLAPYD